MTSLLRFPPDTGTLDWSRSAVVRSCADQPEPQGFYRRDPMPPVVRRRPLRPALLLAVCLACAWCFFVGYLFGAAIG